jgi:hypothetical protein
MDNSQVKSSDASPAQDFSEETVDEQKIIDTLFKEHDQYRKASSTQRSDINDIYDSYCGRMKDVKDQSKSQESTNKLRTETAYIVPSIFSGQPEIEVDGVGEEDKVISQLIEKIINFRLETIPQCYEKIEAWVKQSAVFGTSLIKVCWKFETQDNGDGTQTPVTDEPDLEVPNILDCFYNPIISNVENQNSIIFRSVLSVDEVKNNPMYDFPSKETNEDGTPKLNRDKLTGKGNVTSNQYDSSNQVQGDSIQLEKTADGTVEIFERITKDRIQTVAEDKERLVLRDVENPYGSITSVKLTHEPNAIPNRFDGYGVGQNTLGIGKLYQKMMNRTLDSVALTNNPFFLFKKGARIDKKQLVVRTGGGIEVDGDKPLSEYIQAIQFPDIKQGAINILNKIDDEHKRASGANDLLQGAASNKTLGQDQIASTYSSNRFELIARRFKFALADVAKMIVDMELKNLQSPDASILRIFPDEFDTGQKDQMGQPIMQSGFRQHIYQLLISEDAKNAKYNIRVKGDTTVAKNKDIQIKQLTDAYNLFGAILPPENQMEWARKILELRGIDELDKLVPSAEKVRQNAMQQAGMVDPNQIPQGAINPQMMQQGFPQQPSPMM